MAMLDDQTRVIFDLMQELDAIPFEEPHLGNGDWVPQSPRGKAVFAKLIAPENRERLKMWYARFPQGQLNSAAAGLKASLERAIKEPLT